MRSLALSVASAAALLLASSSALAIERNPSGPHANRGIMMAFAVEGPTEPAPPPAPAPPIDAPAPAAAEPPPATAKAGVTIDVSGGARVLAGEMAEGNNINGIFAPLTVSLGVFVTPRIGISLGVEAGVGGLIEGCVQDCSNAVHFAIPVTVQYAFIDHMRGPYVDAGVALLPTYLASTDTDNHPERSPETLSVSGVADASLGVGYRIPMGTSARSALDIHMGGNAGKFSKLSYGNTAGEVEGDIRSDATAMHYSIALTVGWHFGF